MVFGQAFRSERPSGGEPESKVRPSGRRGGPESEAGAVPPRPGLPVGDWIALLAYRLGTWAGPRVARLVRNVVCWAEPLLGSRSMRDPGFMNPIGAPEPPGDSGRIVWGIFVLTADAHECTRGYSLRAPGQFG